MQSIPSLPGDPGLKAMVVLASIGILSLVAGILGATIRRDWVEFRALGGPILGLVAILAFGRRLAGFHLPLMGGVIIALAWYTRRLSGPYRVSAIAGISGLAGALCAALLLF
jgi:hypothetical protein